MSLLFSFAREADLMLSDIIRRDAISFIIDEMQRIERALDDTGSTAHAFFRMDKLGFATAPVYCITILGTNFLAKSGSPALFRIDGNMEITFFAKSTDQNGCASRKVDTQNKNDHEDNDSPKQEIRERKLRGQKTENHDSR